MSKLWLNCISPSYWSDSLIVSMFSIFWDISLKINRQFFKEALPTNSTNLRCIFKSGIMKKYLDFSIQFGSISSKQAKNSSIPHWRVVDFQFNHSTHLNLYLCNLKGKMFSMYNFLLSNRHTYYHSLHGRIHPYIRSGNLNNSTY